MTAAEERKLVLDNLAKLQETAEGLTQAVLELQNSVKSGAGVMKNMSREINDLKKSIKETEEVIRVPLPIVQAPEPRGYESGEEERYQNPLDPDGLEEKDNLYYGDDDEEFIDDEDEEDWEPEVTKIIRKKRKGRRPKGQRKNLFNPDDYRRLADEDDPDSDYNKVNDNVKATRRSRPKFQMKTVFCQDCKQNVKVHPDLYKEPYYCAEKETEDGCQNQRRR
jgi:hypothetical protein